MPFSKAADTEQQRKKKKKKFKNPLRKIFKKNRKKTNEEVQSLVSCEDEYEPPTPDTSFESEYTPPPDITKTAKEIAERSGGGHSPPDTGGNKANVQGPVVKHMIVDLDDEVSLDSDDTGYEDSVRKTRNSGVELVINPPQVQKTDTSPTQERRKSIGNKNKAAIPTTLEQERPPKTVVKAPSSVLSSSDTGKSNATSVVSTGTNSKRMLKKEDGFAKGQKDSATSTNNTKHEGCATSADDTKQEDCANTIGGIDSETNRIQPKETNETKHSIISQTSETKENDTSTIISETKASDTSTIITVALQKPGSVSKMAEEIHEPENNDIVAKSTVTDTTGGVSARPSILKKMKKTSIGNTKENPEDMLATGRKIQSFSKPTPVLSTQHRNDVSSGRDENAFEDEINSSEQEVLSQVTDYNNSSTRSVSSGITNDVKSLQSTADQSYSSLNVERDEASLFIGDVSSQLSSVEVSSQPSSVVSPPPPPPPPLPSQKPSTNPKWIRYKLSTGKSVLVPKEIVEKMKLKQASYPIQEGNHGSAFGASPPPSQSPPQTPPPRKKYYSNNENRVPPSPPAPSPKKNHHGDTGNNTSRQTISFLPEKLNNSTVKYGSVVESKYRDPSRLTDDNVLSLKADNDDISASTYGAETEMTGYTTAAQTDTVLSGYTTEQTPYDSETVVTTQSGANTEYSATSHTAFTAYTETTGYTEQTGEGVETEFDRLADAVHMLAFGDDSTHITETRESQGYSSEDESRILSDDETDAGTAYTEAYTEYTGVSNAVSDRDDISDDGSRILSDDDYTDADTAYTGTYTEYTGMTSTGNDSVASYTKRARRQKDLSTMEELNLMASEFTKNPSVIMSWL